MSFISYEISVKYKNCVHQYFPIYVIAQKYLRYKIEILKSCSHIIIVIYELDNENAKVREPKQQLT